MADQPEPKNRYVTYAEHSLTNFIQRMNEYKRRYGNKQQVKELEENYENRSTQ